MRKHLPFPLAGAALKRGLLAAAIGGLLLGTCPFGPALAGSVFDDDGGAPPAPLILKRSSSIAGDKVYLSDLFANVPPTADMVIADAPDPGERLAFGTRQLLHYARSAKLVWMPQSKRETLIVQRDSKAVPTARIERAIAGLLAEQYAMNDFDVLLNDHGLDVKVAAETEPRIIVSDLDYDQRTSHFNASIVVTGTDGAPIAVSGRIEPMVAIPVLVRHFMPGEIISERDIEWRRVPAKHATTTVVASPDRLVGNTPRRPITAGRHIRFTDIVPDYLVQKGDLVSIMVQTGNMTLTVRGQALERGAKGDVIRVRNSHSRKTLEGRVVRADTVMVQSSRLAALN